MWRQDINWNYRGQTDHYLKATVSFVPTWARQNDSYKGWQKEEGHSAINVVTREHIINIHKHLHGVGFKNKKGTEKNTKTTRK